MINILYLKKSEQGLLIVIFPPSLLLGSISPQVLLASGPGEVESEPTKEEVFARMHQWLTHRSPSYRRSTILSQLHTQIRVRL